MTIFNETNCPNCGGVLKYYDTVHRYSKGKQRATKSLLIQRMRCRECLKIYRKIPEELLPYKQYEAEIIKGVREGFITPDTLGFEDYPCELTMIRLITRL